MYTRLSRASLYVFLAGIVLALVMVVPVAWFPFQLAKITVFSVLLSVSLLLLVFGGGSKDVSRSHGLYGALLVGLLPLVYLVSAYFSTNPSVAVLGFGIETDTVLFVTLAFLAFLLSFSFFKTLRTVRLLLQVLFWAIVAAVVFQGVAIVFGTSVIPFQTFADRSVNLIGKWNDLGLFAGLLAVFLLVQAELTSASPLKKIATAVMLAVLAVLLGVINFAVVWGLVLASSIVLALVTFITQRVSESSNTASFMSQHWMKRIPWFAAAGILFAVLFLFFGSLINTRLTSIFPVTSLEVRPSYASTLTVINAAREGSFEHVLLGTGPNTFGDSWLAHKPPEVNQSAFWNLDFNVGFSTFVTALGSVGFLGIIAWLIPLLLVLAALVRAVRMSILTREDKIIATSLGLGSLYLIASILLYVPSQNAILLAFVLSGAAFGFLWRQGQSHGETGENDSGRLSRVGIPAFLIALLVLSFWTSASASRRLISQAYTQKGLVALNNNLADEALKDSEIARTYEITSDSLRLAIDAGNVKLRQIALNTSLPQQAAQTQFAEVASSTIALGKQVSKLTPLDYRNDLALARVYDFLASLKIQGAYENAKLSYEAAMKKNMTNPTIQLALARLEAVRGNVQLTSDHLTAALTLKPNYTDAILFVVQLNVANNDIPSATRAAQAAAQSAPGVGPIWFQLGLLYYAANNTKDAIPALEQAIAIIPDYANAKYFLGLSYYAQKRTADALKQFQDLAKSNPDNAEIKLIISNMQQGKPASEGAIPPADQPPQTRPAAPVSE